MKFGPSLSLWKRASNELDVDSARASEIISTNEAHYGSTTDWLECGNRASVPTYYQMGLQFLMTR
jgi:hypothetical protein